MNIALCLMMKNELPRLARLTESVDAINLCEKTFVVDTGSTDGSVEFFASRPNTTLKVVEWKGFGPGRSELMALAHQQADWLLCLDADDVIEMIQGPAIFLDWLSKQTVSSIGIASVYPCMKFYLPRLVSGRTPEPWRFVGACHEYMAGTNDMITTELLHIKHIGDGACAHNRLERNLELLLMDAKADPKNGRTAFYLANTYSELLKTKEAVKWYDKRLALGGWDEETYCALLYRGRNLRSIPDLMAAWKFRPTRAEALASAYELAVEKGNSKLASDIRRLLSVIKIPDDRLFVETAVYQR